MKYGKMEKAKAAKAAADAELERLARMYVESDSMAEFRLKASAAGDSSSKFMKWFRLFYFVKDHSVYGAFPWLAVVPPAVLAVAATGFGVELMSHVLKGDGWQFLCAMTFLLGAGAWSGLAVFAFRFLSKTLERVKDAVWKFE